MERGIVADSCVDRSESIENWEQTVERVAFKITISEEEIIDKDLDVLTLLRKMKECKTAPYTASPSPFDFFEVLKKYKESFVVTISSKLSGAYDSAVMAKNMIADALPDNIVHVFDSRSAAAGENLIVLKIKQLLDCKLSTSQIVENTQEYINNMHTLFILNSLDNLAKNGRIGNGHALVGKLLNIVPIMGSNKDGEIVLKAKARGQKQAFAKMLELIGQTSVDFKHTVLAITHVNAREKAQEVMEQIAKSYPFKEIHIFESGGLSSVYADNGGIIVSF